ncbi:MAG: methyltransferase [Desulforhabdus sp.]|nr:methyltransferase [Desulforhabdus sp.]
MNDQSPILETSGYYWRTCTLHAAVKLEIFTVIGTAGLTGSDVAEKIGGDERATTMLLDALVAMNLLEKKHNRYGNGAASRKYLCKDSPHYVGHIIMHHHHLMESWHQLDRAILTGKPVRARASVSSEEWRESFLMGMFNLAMNLAPKVAAKVDLSSRSHLLDLGGGPGTYAIHFCKANPNLKATVYDLATTRPFAEETIAKFGMSDRIRFLEGNYLELDISGSYDVAWLSQILHGEGPEECRRIINKAVAALKPGGLIMVHEFILNDSMDGPLFPALFSLNMLLGTATGQSYSERQITEMLTEAGVKEAHRLEFRGPNDSGIIAGTV